MVVQFDDSVMDNPPLPNEGNEFNEEEGLGLNNRRREYYMQRPYYDVCIFSICQM